MSRTLVISPNWIGDAVMAQPLLRRLKQKYPERPIDVVAPGWVAPVWRAMREVDTLIESPFKHGSLQWKERKAFAKMLTGRYAESYVLPNTLKFALIPWLAGIPRRVGYKGEMRYGLVNVMHHDDKAAPRPMAQFYAALADEPVRDLPRPDRLPEPEMAVASEEADAAVARLKLPAGTYVAFAPGAEFGPAKRWPAAYFAELAQTILANRPDAQILLLGSPKDRAVCDEITAIVPQAHNLAGTTSLSEAIALIARAAVVVTNDSGLMHIGAALRRPVVAIYGPTDPRHTPPLSELAKVLWLHIECSPCQQRECPLGHQNCMKQILPNDVWQPLQPVLAAA
ncbi:lipopolysaccharide heptosyltransferase II [Massilia sp. IC2-477]|uniref:lipopolysaccharide heptosyltransferase II n=1 Tax=Massilia sp. IC2-477 TaxID=2887198 RepID=UPI001D1173C8|nr:lipopolysaccharide heptosyltransferase II [Massilia sp. IC2-477]MCC2954386.1 lipopolysaccharide heptosyltransferase II [Massilia sp. IC2-477]